jgi:hypothetical protein
MIILKKLPKYILPLIAFMAIIVPSCKSQKNKMKTATKFEWYAGYCSPSGYNAEVINGYLADEQDMIIGLMSGGYTCGSWGGTGASMIIGDEKRIPSELSITWVANAEKKSYKVETKLPKDTMLQLFREGWEELIYARTRKEAKKYNTYSEIIFGMAPGGMLVIWLQGEGRSIEIGRYQGIETEVLADDYYNVQNPKDTRGLTQQQFYEQLYNDTDAVSIAAKKEIETYGISSKKWDDYRKKYNWKVTMEYANKDTKTEGLLFECFNGESEVLEIQYLTQHTYKQRAVIKECRGVRWMYKNRFFTTNLKFNEAEITNAFTTMGGANGKTQFELVCKIPADNRQLQFVLRNATQEIKLEKVVFDVYDDPVDPNEPWGWNKDLDNAEG